MDPVESVVNEDENDGSTLPSGYVRSLISKLEKITNPDVSENNVPLVVVVDNDETKNEETKTKEPKPDGGKSRPFGWIGSLRRSRSNSEKSKRTSQFYSETEPPEAASADASRLTPNDEATSLNSVEFAPFDSDGDSVHNVDPLPPTESSASKKAFLVVKEMVSSEETFIDTLRLLNVDFRNQVEFRNNQKPKIIPEADLRKILNQLTELQILNEDISSDLTARLKNWETEPKVSDVLVKKGAFLKMYATYIQNFDAQTQFLDECCVKYPKFGALVKSFEASDRCKKLTLKHYMLKPVQRIPQYRLLLDDYLKYLNETSPDYENTLTALRIVTNVAEHVNNSMKHGDQVNRMVPLQSMLGDFQLIKPGRELIKEGPLQKVCRKTSKDRYFILLNDCLLYTTLSKTYLKYHQTLSLGGMKVTYKDDDLNMFTFAVYSTTKSCILCAKTEQERKDWVEALNDAITDFIARKRSFMLNSVPSVDQTFELGREAPLWTPDSKVTMCQLCAAEFTQLFRRHHCRACGKVICWKCSNNQAPLQYKSFKVQRVCDPCFDSLLKDFEVNEEKIKESYGSADEESNQNKYLDLKAKFIRTNHDETSKPKKSVPTRLTEVSAKDTKADMSGWLRFWKPHKWKFDKNWYVLKDRVLYVYGASEDVAAFKTISVLGYEVKKGAEGNLDGTSVESVFQLNHKSQAPMIFAADNAEQAERWFLELQSASNFDVL